MRHNFKYVYFVQLVTLFRVKTILHDHFGGIKIENSLPFPFSKNFRPAVYIGVSQDLTDWAITKWKINEKNCYTLINLLNLKFNFKIKGKNKEVKKRGIVILGNIKPIKNQILGLEIANILDTEVTLIGNNQDENYFNKIMSFPSKNKVTILQGIIEPYNHLVDFKLGLCTSISESGPLVLLEYLMCGLPFLAFNTGGISTILSDFFPEYFINNHNPRDWANKILTIQKHFSIIDVEKVNKVIRMHFDNETYRSRLLEIYEKT
jgi:glycosyltransferase involved in cell wall biosynthesis